MEHPGLKHQWHKRGPGVGDGMTQLPGDFPAAAVVYCVLIAVAFLSLWLFYDRRDHMRFDRERRRSTFHCTRCDRLYTAPEGAELCLCPRCGHENARLRF